VQQAEPFSPVTSTLVPLVSSILVTLSGLTSGEPTGTFFLDSASNVVAGDLPPVALLVPDAPDYMLFVYAGAVL